jgi:hypothetical protein
VVNLYDATLLKTLFPSRAGPTSTSGTTSAGEAAMRAPEQLNRERHRKTVVSVHFHFPVSYLRARFGYVVISFVVAGAPPTMK